MIGEKRSELEILRDILDLARRGERKTRIMYRANLSYDMLNRYLGFLVTRRFLVPTESGSFRVTDAGHVFLSDVERVVQQLSMPPTESPSQ